MTPAVMVCGTTSGAGKSFLTTALCRWYARHGLQVAPFKAQNMSNNARVVAAGEMGSAQYFQALAARALPDVRMNPVLLKPETDTHSQVIVLGTRRDDLSRLPWLERPAHLWPIIEAALSSLAQSHELLVIEGAGSPAEINLQPHDIVNMRVAAAAQAATLIVCDIDRGGAFAHLYGTHHLLSAQHRRLIRGFVLNKFRGDARLLAPGPAQLQALTGVPTLGVLPLWRGHGLPEEDGVFDATPGAGHATPGGGTPGGDGRPGSGYAIAIVAYPRISNLDEFAALQAMPSVSVYWARRPQSIDAADLLILPGSKHVAGDLEWLRSTGLDAAIARHIAADKPTLALCGGLQMLGGAIRDPAGVEGAAHGLGLLPYATEFAAVKHTRQDRYHLSSLTGHWARLSGIVFDAYEIRHGQTQPDPAHRSAHALRQALADGAGWQHGETLALYTHGLFESAAALKALFGAGARTLDDTFDGLADFIDEHLGAAALWSLLE